MKTVLFGWPKILDTTEFLPEDVTSGNFFYLFGATICKSTGEQIDVFVQELCSLQIANKIAVGPD